MPYPWTGCATCSARTVRRRSSRWRWTWPRIGTRWSAGRLSARSLSRWRSVTPRWEWLSAPETRYAHFFIGFIIATIEKSELIPNMTYLLQKIKKICRIGVRTKSWILTLIKMFSLYIISSIYCKINSRIYIKAIFLYIRTKFLEIYVKFVIVTIKKSELIPHMTYLLYKIRRTAGPD